jgi:hypothetical protein
MGRLYSFSCPSCTYRAEVCGGTEPGMALDIATILCQPCERLYDVVTFERGVDGRHGPREARCPRAKRHPMRLWTFPDICPKCGTQMEDHSVTLMWD